MRSLLHRMNGISSRMFSGDDRGQDLLEYGLLMALIAIVALAAVGTVGQTIYNVFWKAIGASV
jgi:Flp pilus assembly pilin Flp